MAPNVLPLQVTIALQQKVIIEKVIIAMMEILAYSTLEAARSAYST